MSKKLSLLAIKSHYTGAVAAGPAVLARFMAIQTTILYIIIYKHKFQHSLRLFVVVHKLTEYPTLKGCSTMITLYTNSDIDISHEMAMVISISPKRQLFLLLFWLPICSMFSMLFVFSVLLKFVLRDPVSYIMFGAKH